MNLWSIPKIGEQGAAPWYRVREKPRTRFNENTPEESALNMAQEIRSKADFIFDTTIYEDCRPDVY